EKHWKEPAEVAARLRGVREALEALEAWEPEAVEGALRGAAERLGIGFGKVVHPLRLALTGATVSPGIDQVVAQMGRELTLRRIDAAVGVLEGAEGERGNS